MIIICGMTNEAKIERLSYVQVLTNFLMKLLNIVHLFVVVEYITTMVLKLIQEIR